MGSGKSTVGKILSKMLGREFVDLDDVIVEAAGMTIPEIFKNRGETVFREMEARAAARFSAGRWVVALGGGTLVNEDTRDILFTRGIVVYLRARPATLACRLKDHMGDRPLLSCDEPLTQRITSLLEDRSQTYSLAHWTLDTDDLSPEQVAEKLFQRIKENEHEKVDQRRPR